MTGYKSVKVSEETHAEFSEIAGDFKSDSRGLSR